MGDFKLKNGGTIPNAKIAYKTFGESTSPAVIYPSVRLLYAFACLRLLLTVESLLQVVLGHFE